MAPVQHIQVRIYLDDQRHKDGWMTAVGDDLANNLITFDDLRVYPVRLDQIEAMQDISGPIAVDNFKKRGFHIAVMTERKISNKGSSGRPSLKATEAALDNALRRELYIRSAEIDWLFSNYPATTRKPPFADAYEFLACEIKELAALAAEKLTDRKDMSGVSAKSEAFEDGGVAHLFIYRQMDRARKVKYRVFGDKRLSGEDLRERYLVDLSQRLFGQSERVFDAYLAARRYLIGALVRGSLRAVEVRKNNAKIDENGRKYHVSLQKLAAKGIDLEALTPMSDAEIQKKFGKKVAIAASFIDKASNRIENIHGWQVSLGLGDMIALALFAGIDPYEICSDHIVHRDLVECARAFSAYLNHDKSVPIECAEKLRAALTKKAEEHPERTAEAAFATILHLYESLNHLRAASIGMPGDEVRPR